MIVTVGILLLFSVGILALSYLARDSNFPANVTPFRPLPEPLPIEEPEPVSSWGVPAEEFLGATQGRQYKPDDPLPPLDETGDDDPTAARVWEIARDGKIREVAPENESPPSVLAHRYNSLKNGL